MGTNVATRATTAVHTVGPALAVLLAEADYGRNCAVVHNESGVLFVGLGSTVSSTQYAYRLVGNCTLELQGYIGALSGIKATGSTSVFVTCLV